ncbi:MAG: MotA/TolQ/ExbB proton channel family protein [Synergistaceae bacterium]|nr:MotA/TolQ/ExbB proton channel family protein [Synergistaceae bacterium]
MTAESGFYAEFRFYMDAGGPAMWAILFLSIAGAAAAAERVLFFALAGRRALPFADGEGADPPLSNPDLSLDALRLLAESRIREDLFEWQKHLFFLEIVIRAAPMLGLLGTVLGMVEMFRVLNAGGAIDAAAVTGGIREALFTTVAGLCCAVPLLVVHGILSAALDGREERLNRAADRWILARLKPGDPHAGAG